MYEVVSKNPSLTYNVLDLLYSQVINCIFILIKFVLIELKVAVRIKRFFMVTISIKQS